MIERQTETEVKETKKRNAKTAIERIHEFLRFGSKLGLERMEALMEKLGHPEETFKVVHIAGTNGKGSVAKYIYSTLLKAGYKAGLYTSPYLEVFNERIEFMGEYISDDDLEECTDTVLGKVEEMLDEGLESPTEFEVVTAVCLLYFKEKGCEIAVLEVGLGGRGDSTNIIKDPLVSVITSISYDHMDRLGDTIEKIAGEKAGIIKAGCPVVISTEREDAKKVFEKKAEELGSKLYDARSIMSADIRSSGPSGSTFDITVKSGDGEEPVLKDVTIGMAGEHQITNALEAVLALKVMYKEHDDIEISDDDIRAGLKEAGMPGRFEVMYEPEEGETAPWVILDGAHNPDGAKVLADSMDKWFQGKRVLVVTGMLSDKDVTGILKETVRFGKDYIATEPGNPRKIDAGKLAEMINIMDKMVYEIPDPKDAVALAMSIGKGYDAVLFSGSLYLIGEVRTLLREHYLKEDDICFSREDKEDEFTVGVIESEEDD